MKLLYKFIIFGSILIALHFNSFARQRINEIYLDKQDVFDSSQSDWFFAAPLANSLHVLTKDYVIEDELLFDKDDELDFDDIYETERNLRLMKLFTSVKIEIDTINDYSCDLIVKTQDRWSTTPNILFGSGGNQTNWGGKIEENNLVGTGTSVLLEALHRSENNIGWQGRVELYQRRLFRTEFSILVNILAHKYRTEQDLSFYKPFRTLSTEWSYGFTGKNHFGNEFKYDGNYELMQFHERNYLGWLSHSWRRMDRVFATVALELNDVNRGKPEFGRAYDNSGRFYIAFSSVSEDYIKTNNLNQWQDEDLPIGGWGTAILGKTFAYKPGSYGLYYAAGQGEKSFLWKDWYFFGQLTGASGFSSGFGVNTYEEFMGLCFFKPNHESIIAARIRQQSVWNWDGLRQLVLDNDYGLRGYEVNKLSGDNRIMANLEYRYFPDFNIWFLKVGAALFWDIGSVWQRERELMNAQWHNSVGLGLRLQNMKSTGSTSIFRIDFAFNFDEKKFGSIIFTTDQLFSVFKKHEFNLPQLFGTEFDYE
ncbi:MAG: hypothetical protein EPN82_02165 [Bacteroidetes bacterium]|nr:MAG: hypothetical protein EPN82_02165 [Bacteroidota bacterium]